MTTAEKKAQYSDIDFERMEKWWGEISWDEKNQCWTTIATNGDAQGRHVFFCCEDDIYIYEKMTP